jgi:hypothetical protein
LVNRHLLLQAMDSRVLPRAMVSRVQVSREVLKVLAVNNLDNSRKVQVDNSVLHAREKENLAQINAHLLCLRI